MNSDFLDQYLRALDGRAATRLGRRILKFQGADHVRYLNGQVTNHVAALQPGHSLWAAVTNTKGKMDGEAWLTRQSDFILADLPSSLGESLPARFEKYIIADDVTVSDVTDEWDLYHTLGTISSIPAEIVANSCRFGKPGLDIWVKKGSPFPLAIAAPYVWEAIRIENRFPLWEREMTHDTLPPELGWENLMISYQKGCYIGQEIISRLKSVGHVNRSLLILETDSGTVPDLPEEVSSEGQKAGILTSSCYSPFHKKVVALGLIHRHYVESNQPLKSHDQTWTIHP